MKTIWKYPFEIKDYIEIEMPGAPFFIHAGYQGNAPCMWFAVHPNNPKEVVKFRIFGTGHQIEHPGALMHLATIQDPLLPLVWHIFKEL